MTGCESKASDGARTQPTIAGKLTRNEWQIRGGFSCSFQLGALSLQPNNGKVSDEQMQVSKNPGEGTSYVGQYGMLGYTWVIFEKFSVLFPRDGYLFSTKFLYFFCKVGIYFEEKFCICWTRWNPFTRNFLYFIPQSSCILHIKFLYISTWWVSFQEIYCSGWYCTSGWNQLKRSCQLSQTLLIDLNNHLLRTGLFTDLSWLKQLAIALLYISVDIWVLHPKNSILLKDM